MHAQSTLDIAPPSVICTVPLVNSDLVAIVDADDFPRVSQFKWRLREGTEYNQTPYAQLTTRPYTSMQVFILPPPVGIDVDHRNGDGLDNRRCNLRHGTRSQNCGNAPMRKTNRSGYKGVSTHNNGKTWFATITVNHVVYRSGSCDTKEDAARWYDDMARLHWGEFACVNFPLPGERSARPID